MNQDEDILDGLFLGDLMLAPEEDLSHSSGAVRDSRRCTVSVPANEHAAEATRGAESEKHVKTTEGTSETRLNEHITIWNRVECRKVAGNAAPMRRNVHKYLAAHPECEIYCGQDKERMAVGEVDARTGRVIVRENEHIAIWHRSERRKITGNAAPLRQNLEAYLKRNPLCEVYAGQDKSAMHFGVHAKEPTAAQGSQLRKFPVQAAPQQHEQRVAQPMVTSYSNVVPGHHHLAPQRALGQEPQAQHLVPHQQSTFPTQTVAASNGYLFPAPMMAPNGHVAFVPGAPASGGAAKGSISGASAAFTDQALQAQAMYRVAPQHILPYAAAQAQAQQYASQAALGLKIPTSASNAGALVSAAGNTQLPPQSSANVASERGGATVQRKRQASTCVTKNSGAELNESRRPAEGPGMRQGAAQVTSAPLSTSSSVSAASGCNNSALESAAEASRGSPSSVAVAVPVQKSHPISSASMPWDGDIGSPALLGMSIGSLGRAGVAMDMSLGTPAALHFFQTPTDLNMFIGAGAGHASGANGASFGKSLEAFKSNYSLAGFGAATPGDGGMMVDFSPSNYLLLSSTHGFDGTQSGGGGASKDASNLS
eukprot:CAMPEP_0185841202 /NCGR_PEP_ID=MMETSP1353-20130828/17509_1 /TAXON_ID=1077150 /ORGANISM="Erythrolobus australicus, Strain CCMP3124" /LENGTH=596 /DNA_ID=CAMNT_0028540627 /DNA_START=38 /DNA_END=1828 /DNA_ORIENTATION=-